MTRSPGLNSLTVTTRTKIQPAKVVPTFKERVSKLFTFHIGLSHGVCTGELTVTSEAVLVNTVLEVFVKEVLEEV